MATLIRWRALTRPPKRPSDDTGLLPAGQRASRFRFEGVSLALSGVLFFAKALLDMKVGGPPSGGAELLAWQSAEKVSLEMTNEILFFAVVLLIPGVIGLYSSLAPYDRRRAGFGCGIVAGMIPVMMALTIIHGRLSFPVYSIDLKDPAVMQLVISIYYGGQHAVSLLFCLATVLLALAMRNSPYGKTIIYLGFTIALADLVGAYPWLIGPVLTTATEVLFAGWFIAVGIRLASSDFHRAAPVTT